MRPPRHPMLKTRFCALSAVALLAFLGGCGDVERLDPPAPPTPAPTPPQAMLLNEGRPPGSSPGASPDAGWFQRRLEESRSSLERTNGVAGPTPKFGPSGLDKPKH